jgi:hypothetical protein
MLVFPIENMKSLIFYTQFDTLTICLCKMTQKQTILKLFGLLYFSQVGRQNARMQKSQDLAAHL